MITKATKFPYEVAVSSVEYDVRLVRELDRHLTLRIADSASRQPVWTDAIETSDEAPRAAAFGKASRVVVVMHQHMWGKDPATKSDAAAIKRRITASGADSVLVVMLDKAPVASWLRACPTRSLGEGELRACADWVMDAVLERGGATPVVVAEDVVVRQMVNGRPIDQRDAFLGSHRAITHLGREFDRLAGEVVRRAATVKPDDVEIPLKVDRVPGRCTVQLGPVALTLSWVRTRPDSVATGRLMIIEWEGQVGRVNSGGGASAVPIRERVLRADATRVDDWQWRSEEVAGSAYDSNELAAYCVDSLACALQDRAGV